MPLFNKKITSKATVIIVVLFLLCYETTHAQATHKQIKKWVKERSWAKGLDLQLHRSVNADSFYVAYHRNPALWDAAFNFLSTHNLDELAPGKYPIDGEKVYASVSEAATHKKEDVKWESHSEYIDLQYIITGKEIIGVADTAKATITKPYSPDVINYTAKGKYYLAGQGEFFLFFPNDAHRPTIKAEGFDSTKKIVIKIKSAPQTN